MRFFGEPIEFEKQAGIGSPVWRGRAAGDAAAEDEDVGVDRFAQSIFGPTASMRSTERSARTRMSSGTSIT